MDGLVSLPHTFDKTMGSDSHGLSLDLWLDTNQSWAIRHLFSFFITSSVLEGRQAVTHTTNLNWVTDWIIFLKGFCKWLYEKISSLMPTIKYIQMHFLMVFISSILVCGKDTYLTRCCYRVKWCHYRKKILACITMGRTVPSCPSIQAYQHDRLKHNKEKKMWIQQYSVQTCLNSIEAYMSLQWRQILWHFIVVR